MVSRPNHYLVFYIMHFLTQLYYDIIQTNSVPKHYRESRGKVKILTSVILTLGGIHKVKYIFSYSEKQDLAHVNKCCRWEDFTSTTVGTACRDGGCNKLNM